MNHNLNALTMLSMALSKGLHKLNEALNKHKKAEHQSLKELSKPLKKALHAVMNELNKLLDKLNKDIISFLMKAQLPNENEQSTQSKAVQPPLKQDLSKLKTGRED